MCTPAHACVHVICRHEQRDALLHEAEAGKEMGHAYAQKAAAVAEAVSTSDLRSTLLEDQCKLLAQAVRDEEAKVYARDEMLHSLQAEFADQRARLSALETRAEGAQHVASRADAAKRDAEGEQSTLHEKLQLAMLEVNARAERLDYANAQAHHRATHAAPPALPPAASPSPRAPVTPSPARLRLLARVVAQMAAARAELRALDNQLVIVSNQLSTTQQENTQISEAAATRAAQLAAVQSALRAKEERLDAAQGALAEARTEAQRQGEAAGRLQLQLDAAREEVRLREQQLTLVQHKHEFAQARRRGPTRLLWCMGG